MKQKLRDLAMRAGRILVIALCSLREILTTAWRIARGPIMFTLQVLAALIVLFEEWGWKPLSDALAGLAKFTPVATLERWITGLPPYGALAVFALPATLLFPLKLVAVWLLAQGHAAAATVLFVSVKLVSTALLARILTLTKPALMRIDWFARAYNTFVPWKDALFAMIRESWAWRYGRMVNTRIHLEIKQAWTRWRTAPAGTVSERIASTAESLRNRLKK